MRSSRLPPNLVLTLHGLVFTAALTACPAAEQPNANSAGQGSAVPASEQIREAKGVDLQALNEAQRESFFTLINQEPSACAKPHSLATSLRDDPDCRNSVVVAQVIAERLAAGMSPGAIKPLLDEVIAALTPQPIAIEGRPTIGNPSAPVTVVVFADFQCGACKAEVPALREEVKERRGQVRLVFKHFPLGGHPRAEPAALAVEAAHQQGKFWEMHDLVFANQAQLEDADLERYAKQIPELDFAKWQADLAAPTTSATVSSDRADGRALAISGTPAVFVDGRQITQALWDGELSAWIDDALRR